MLVFNSFVKIFVFNVAILILNYLTFGMVSKVWKAGGDETDHSKVLSSDPQGLLEVLRFFTKASMITTKNIIAPNAPM